MDIEHLDSGESVQYDVYHLRVEDEEIHSLSYDLVYTLPKLDLFQGVRLSSLKRSTELPQ